MIYKSDVILVAENLGLEEQMTYADIDTVLVKYPTKKSRNMRREDYLIIEDILKEILV